MSATSNLGRSLAIWGRINPDNETAKNEISIQLHFNLWGIPSEPQTNGDKNFLDIGVLFASTERLQSLNIFIPFTIDKAHLSDLGNQFSDRKVAVAIFNEDAQVTSNNHTIDIKLSDDRRVEVYQLDVESEIEIEATDDESGQDSGTIISLSDLAIGRLPKEFAYLRIRIVIDSSNSNPFSSYFEQQDSHLLSGHHVTEFVDFRVNESRNLPRPILKKIDDCRDLCTKISEVHFFLVREQKWSFLHAHRDFHKCRLLEPAIWNDYIQDVGHRLASNLVIYHWRKRPEDETSIEDYNALARFVKHSSSVRQQILFIGLAMVIGAIGSLIATGLSAMAS